MQRLPNGYYCYTAEVFNEPLTERYVYLHLRLSLKFLDVIQRMEWQKSWSNSSLICICKKPLHKRLTKDLRIREQQFLWHFRSPNLTPACRILTSTLMNWTRPTYGILTSLVAQGGHHFFAGYTGFLSHAFEEMRTDTFIRTNSSSTSEV